MLFGASALVSKLLLDDVGAQMLAGIVVFGGIVAPLLLMLGLERVSGIAGSLLLNLERPLTLLVGIVVVHEFWVGAPRSARS